MTTSSLPDPGSPLTAADAFADNARRFVTEALPNGIVYGVTTGRHSVAVDADESSGALTVRVNDHQGQSVEMTTTAEHLDADLRSMWRLVAAAGIQATPEEASGPGPRPRRKVRPTASSVLEFAARHLEHVGLHPGPWEWARDAQRGPATIPHALTLAVRQLDYGHRDAVGTAALGRLADFVNGRPVVVPTWWNATTGDYYRATVWNWGIAPRRTAAGAAAFLRGAAALAAA
ncbi:DUF6197 family protein [Kitasatospora sp. NPDC048296]|uniref:DUF6197 family protein n=1 Tax=Kitasatospora sp. NPDC048296 TaxID=3364048 RepID=UPI003717E4FF